MEKNVGKIDRLLRIVVGIAIIAFGFMTDSLWGLVGLVPILTAIIGWCPLYCPLKINTSCESSCSKE